MKIFLNTALRLVSLKSVLALVVALIDHLADHADTKTKNHLWRRVKTILQRDDVFSLRTLVSLAIEGIDYVVYESPGTLDDALWTPARAALILAADNLRR